MGRQPDRGRSPAGRRRDAGGPAQHLRTELSGHRRRPRLRRHYLRAEEQGSGRAGRRAFAAGRASPPAATSPPSLYSVSQRMARPRCSCGRSGRRGRPPTGAPPPPHPCRRWSGRRRRRSAQVAGGDALHPDGQVQQLLALGVALLRPAFRHLPITSTRRNKAGPGGSSLPRPRQMRTGLPSLLRAEVSVSMSGIVGATGDASSAGRTADTGRCTSCRSRCTRVTRAPSSSAWPAAASSSSTAARAARQPSTAARPGARPSRLVGYGCGVPSGRSGR